MDMEQKHICASICDQLPTTLSANHPWLVDQSPEEDDTSHYFLFTTRAPLSQCWCRIPSFLGRRIRGCFHGWVVLSNHPHNDMWSLWNPVISKIIRLPRLISKNGVPDSDYVQQCCLSSPPDVPGSVFMLMLQTDEYAIAFCRLDCNRKRLKWVQMSYAKQMRSMTGGFDGYLHSLTCCNGKVYALHTGDYRHNRFVIHIDIVVKGRETMINLLPYLKSPPLYIHGCCVPAPFLKGCCTELFYITVGYAVVAKETIAGVCVYKLDMQNMKFEEMKDLKGATFFLDLAHDYSVFYCPAVASNLGGYVHILDEPGNVIHSYDVKNKTIALSLLPTTNASLLEHRLQGDHEEIKCGADPQQEYDRENEMVVRAEENTGSRLLSLPFDVLKMIMEFCVGVEYLNFRASCKQCQLAAPVIQWSKGGRLQAYSLISPWLMVLHKDLGIISFTDPMFGDKYFIKTPRELIGDFEIHCSMYGWMLIRKHSTPLTFFNPLTGDIRELPYVPYLDSYCFSAPPTSSDCMVVGFTTYGEWHVYIHYLAREPFWRRFHLDFRGNDSHSFRFATTYGQHIYAKCSDGGLHCIDIDQEDYMRRQVLPEGPRSMCESSRQDFLMKCDQHLLLVIVAEFGESVEVFKLNDSMEWERIESLGRHMVYICGATCLCIEAKTPEMENKVYFPRVHSENEKIVFYSLETRRYHTFNGKNIKQSFGDFMGTIHHLDPHVWIEPNLLKVLCKELVVRDEPRWNKLIHKSYENGDMQGLKLAKGSLRPLMLMLRRTEDKEERPIHIQIIECEQSEAEHDFYDALFKRSKDVVILNKTDLVSRHDLDSRLGHLHEWISFKETGTWIWVQDNKQMTG
ncbi:hypothetical protein SSX86_016002 [Deinandra increscens subsp. villosa]|uniref:KIB1-4 beta-propeller domain-containing protein n=1 Tax=Deinandra increscens subsp. villosa TaxID=3103831 RepID=A0AAP0GZL2_9ASTR